MPSDVGSQEVIREVLPGGLRVVLETIPYVRSVSVGVWVGVGSRHEEPDAAGVSHLVEHLLFKGTGRRTARQIAEEMDAIGGLLNGYTSKEYTCYYVKVLDHHLDKAVDLLSDLVLAPRLDPEDLAKERGVVLEELKMYEDSPDELAGDLLAEAAWGEDPLGRAVLGREQTITAMTPRLVADYHRSAYRRPRTVVALAGNVSHEHGLEMVRRYFTAMPEAGPPSPARSPRFEPGFRSRTKTVEQAHLCLGYDAVAMSDPALYDFHLLAGILGGGSSSRLFQTIREERGLAYSVYAFASPYSDVGLMGVYAGVSPERALEVTRLISSEIEVLRCSGPTDEELARAKDQVKASILLALENTANRMSRLGKSLLLLGRVLSPDELSRRIDAVTAESVTALAARILDPRRAAVAIVGPSGLPSEPELRDALQTGA